MLLKPLGILRSTRWCDTYPSVTCGDSSPFRGALGGAVTQTSPLKGGGGIAVGDDGEGII